jgi:hypothetical protein
MEVLDVLKQAVKACADVVRWGAGIQEATRRGLVADLQAICTNCDAAYDAVLVRLVPVKNAFTDPVALATELRAFSADTATRAKFKPSHLCGQVDDLLVRIGSNLDPLKYSVDCRRITHLRQNLQRFGNFDGAIFQSYDELSSDLDTIATQMQDPAFDKQERARYARHVIEDFENSLRATQIAVREAKADTISVI